MILSPHGKLLLVGDDLHKTNDNNMKDTIAEIGLVSTNLTLSVPNPVQIYVNTDTEKHSIPSKRVFFLLDPSSASQSKLAAKMAVLWKDLSIEVFTSGNLQDAMAAEDLDSTVFVSLLELDHPFVHILSEQDYSLLKQFFQTTRDVLWVTSDGDSIPGNPEYAIIQGLTRVLRNEYPHLNITVATFEKRIQLSGSQIESITQLLVDRHVDPKPWIVDAEFREMEGCLQIPRVAQNTRLTRDLYRRAKSQVSSQLEIQNAPPLAFAFKPGNEVDDAHFEEDKDSSLPLAINEVEVQVEAMAMSSTDILIAKSQVLECAGIVTRVGASTSFQPGDRVLLAAPGSFRTYTRGEIAVRIAENMSNTTAAAIPADFGSAWTILQRLARLEEDETVLVHSAANTMGQAAIQVAKLLGARVLATVGSKNEKLLLISEYNIPEAHIFYGGSSSFETRVLEVTNGRGVDVIINTLVGDGFESSWKCIASHGRFVETVRQASMSSLSIPSFATGRNASFTMFNLHLYVTERPKVFRQDLETVMDLFSQGKLRSPPRLQVRDISQIGDAFKESSNEKMDKYVFKVSPESKVQVRHSALCTQRATNHCTSGNNRQ
jgi:NADPH:quinone reductase-like Zn-dependent oxidoreductase